MTDQDSRSRLMAYPKEVLVEFLLERPIFDSINPLSPKTVKWLDFRTGQLKLRRLLDKQEETLQRLKATKSRLKRLQLVEEIDRRNRAIDKIGSTGSVTRLETEGEGMTTRDLTAERCSVCVKFPQGESGYWRPRVAQMAQEHYGDAWGNGLTDKWAFVDCAFPAKEKADAFIAACEKRGLATLLEYVGNEKVGSSEAFLRN